MLSQRRPAGLMAAAQPAAFVGGRSRAGRADVNPCLRCLVLRGRKRGVFRPRYSSAQSRRGSGVSEHAVDLSRYYHRHRAGVAVNGKPASIINGVFERRNFAISGQFGAKNRLIQTDGLAINHGRIKVCDAVGGVRGLFTSAVVR